jgi:hypothetical protein
MGALLLAVAAGPSPAAAAGKIYRTVDEDGNVVFTDVPPPPGQRGDAVELDAPNSFSPDRQTAPSMSLEAWLERDEAETAEDGDGDGAGTATRYHRLEVVTPPNDAGIRQNAGTVVVTAAVEPELAPGHALQLYLDGSLRQTSRDTTFQLVNVDRGTHAVELRVVDEAGTVLATSDPSVFHLQRRSVILQPAPNSPASAP